MANFSQDYDSFIEQNVSCPFADCGNFTWPANIPQSTTVVYGEDVVYFANPLEMLIPWVINEYFFIIMFTYVITFVIGVTGNIIVIVVMAGDAISRNVTSVFLMSLAVADLLLLVICAPLDVAHYFVVQWDSGSTICKLAAYAETVSAFASVLNLSAVTLERFVVIVFPLRSRSICTMKNCRRVVYGVWIVSLLAAIPVFYGKKTVKTIFTNNVDFVTSYACTDDEEATGYGITIYRLTALFAIPSVIMIVCYACVICQLWLSTKPINGLAGCLSGHPLRRNVLRANERNNAMLPRASTAARLQSAASDLRDIKKTRRQVIKMLILVVILFLVCWGPRLIMDLYIKCCLDNFSHGVYTTRLVVYQLPFVHSCLNPIVYCFMSTKFRKRMLRMFRRSCVGHFKRCCIRSCPCCFRSGSGQPTQPMVPLATINFRARSTICGNEASRMSSAYTFATYDVPSPAESPISDLHPRHVFNQETISL